MGSGTSGWSGRFVRLRMLDRRVRLTVAGLPDGGFPLQPPEGGGYRLLALVVALLEEGVEVGGIRCSTRAALDTNLPGICPTRCRERDGAGTVRCDVRRLASVRLSTRRQSVRKPVLFTDPTGLSPEGLRSEFWCSGRQAYPREISRQPSERGPPQRVHHHHWKNKTNLDFLSFQS